MRSFSRIALLALALAAASAAAAQEAAPVPLSKRAAEAVFFLDVSRCLLSLESGGGVEGLPDRMKVGLRPAALGERFLFKDPGVKVWAQNPYGSHVLLAEKAPARCDVIADQLPVDETFQVTLARLKQEVGGFSEVAVRPGYNPIAYQIERVENGVRYIVHLEGSEPGGLGHPDRMLAGHAFRFSLLNAFVVKQPETAKPLFR